MTKRLLVLAAIVAIALSAQPQTRRRPVQPGLPPGSACPAITLAAGAFSFEVGLDGSFIYFDDGSSEIFRKPKAGGTSEQIASLPELAVLFKFDDTNIDVLTIDGTGEFGSVWEIVKNGSTGRELVTGILTPFDLAVDSHAVYWISLGTPSGSSFLADGKIQTIGKDGTGGKTLLSNLNTPAALVSDGANLYFTEAGQSTASTSAGVRAVPVGGGPVRQIVNGVAAVIIAQTDTDLFYSTTDATGDAGTIQRVAKSGGTPQTIVASTGFVEKIVIQGATLYYFDSGPTSERIMSVPLTGGTPVVAVAGSFNTGEFDVDDCSIYWVDDAGNVQRTPR